MSNSYTRPKVGVGVYIVNDRKEILLGLRKNKLGHNCWSPPGGHLEHGETIEECAARESLEEAGVVLKDIRVLGFTNDISKEEGTHYITLMTAARIKSGNVQNMEPHKLDHWEWVAWDKFPSPLFLPVINFRRKFPDFPFI